MKNNKLELNWYGKEIESKVEPRILIEDKGKSYYKQNSSSDKADIYDNILIHGDNLLGLKALEGEYSNKIKCIYIDPPYNLRNQLENYDDNLEHSKWLSLMRSRLILLRKLLSEEGLIWIQIDDEEQAYLKVLCDEIFGKNCFVAMITVESGEVFGRKAAHINKTFVKVKDYIIIYKKSQNIEVKIKPLYTAMSECFDTHYSNYIDVTTLERQPLIKYLKNSKWISDLFEKNNLKLSLDNISKLMKINNDFNNYITKEIAENIFQDQPLSSQIEGEFETNKIYRFKNLLVFKTSTGSFRYYQSFKDSLHRTSDYEEKFCRSTARGDLWKNYHIDMRNIDDEGSVKFKSSKKPERLIRDILYSCTEEGDLVLDSFLGSGTTAAVAHKMKRKWIGIEMGEHAYTHCKKRMDLIIEGQDNSGITKVTNWTGGGGYKFYELAPTLINNDEFGQEIINPAYNSDMLAAAIALHEGYKYNPNNECYWKQSINGNNSFLFVTTNHVTKQIVDSILVDLKDDEHLLISCKSFDTNATVGIKNISIKKIPQSLLKNCEWGKNDYKLNIISPPTYKEEENYE